MDCILFSKGIFLTQRLNPGLLHCRQILYCLSHCPDTISIQKGYCFSYSKKKKFNSHFCLPLLSQFYLPFTLRLHRKDLCVQCFLSSHYLNNYKELDHIEGWAPRNWCFWIGVLEKTLESLLNSKEIKPVNPKGSQVWIFIGRSDVEALILGPPDGKEPTHWKRPWCWERLRAGLEGGNRGWDGGMASPTQ